MEGDGSGAGRAVKGVSQCRFLGGAIGITPAPQWVAPGQHIPINPIKVNKLKHKLSSSEPDFRVWGRIGGLGLSHALFGALGKANPSPDKPALPTAETLPSCFPGEETEAQPHLRPLMRPDTNTNQPHTTTELSS